MPASFAASVVFLSTRIPHAEPKLDLSSLYETCLCLSCSPWHAQNTRISFFIGLQAEQPSLTRDRAARKKKDDQLLLAEECRRCLGEQGRLVRQVQGLQYVTKKPDADDQSCRKDDGDDGMRMAMTMMMMMMSVMMMTVSIMTAM